MGDEDDDVASTEELPPAANKKVEEEQDPKELKEQLEKFEVVKASEKLQEFKDTRNPYEIFESPAAAKSPSGKPKGRFGGSQTKRSGDQSGGQSEDGEGSLGTEQKNFRGWRQRVSFGNENEMHTDQEEFKGEHENNRVEQRVGYQPHRGQSSMGARERSRGGQTGSLRGGSVEGQGHHQGFRNGDVRMPVPLMPPDLGFGDDDTLHPQGGHGNRGGRGHQPKPKSKSTNSVRGYRGRVQGGYSKRQDECQEGDQFSYDQSQFTQRKHYPERGRGQQNQGRTKPRGRNVSPMFLGDFASGNTGARRVCDDSDLGRLGGFDSNRLEQANRGRLRDSGNRGRGQRGMRYAQSLSSLVGCDQSSGTRENTEERYGFERHKLRIRGLSESTTDDALTNFIEAMSGEEVKEVQKLRNGNAIITMVKDITSKSMLVIFIPPL